MILTPSFYNRSDHTTPLLAPRGDYLPAESVSYNVIGGCESTTLRVRGDADTLKAWMELLDTDVVLRDEQGAAWWWGHVYSAKVRWGNVWIGKSLDAMRNKIAVCYTIGNDAYISSYATATTDYTRDGIYFESIESLEKITDSTEAAQLQQVLLNNSQYPSRILEIGGEADYDCELECRGNWLKLERTNVTNTGIAQSVEPADPATFAWMTNRVAFGSDQVPPPRASEWGILFTAAQSCYINQISLYVGSNGARTFTAKLYTKLNTTNPTAGTLLATATMAVGQADWYTAACDTPAQITAGTQYWLHFTTSYQWYNQAVIGLIPGSSAGCRYWDWDLTTWMDVGTAFSIGAFTPMYRLYGTLANETQVSNIVATNTFFAGVDSVASGRVSNPYQDGTQTAKDVIEQICKVGTSNNKRMLPSVGVDRYIRIVEEPLKSKSTAPYRLNNKGEITYANGQKITENPVGQWAVCDFVNFPDNVDDDPSLFFIESCEWSNGEWRITAKSQQDELDFWRQQNR